MNTADLITALSADTALRWTFGRLLAVATVIGTAIAAAVFLVGIGVRPDALQAIATLRYPLKFVETLALAIGSMGLVFRLARPGMPLGIWRWALGVAPVLLVGAVVGELLAVPSSEWSQRLIGSNARFCVTLIPLMAIGPLVCILYALRQGAPTRPRLAGALAGLAASGIAATFYAAHCPDDSPLFVATWYPLATGFIVLIGTWAGNRYLRW